MRYVNGTHYIGCLPAEVVDFDNIEDAIEDMRQILQYDMDLATSPKELQKLKSASYDLHTIPRTVGMTWRGWRYQVGNCIYFIELDK